MKVKNAQTLKWCTDACARCDHIQRPWHVASVNRTSVRTDYECAKCSYKWFTSWDLQFAVDHALSSKYQAEHPD